ncbi:MAG: hypothetical protein E5Y01_16310 [Mesorhizobium sp.]|uniref:hypothetical protein n=1 Tax=Mesorhizobium sp. TaxID=1871066 RepID=UPI001220C8A4|nr:hypothetical protein [Mesorhizobium sp.]TJV51149.1 MAG: hypothetical protein E5Y01_16310 [Mesorhizobium sp.]
MDDLYSSYKTQTAIAAVAVGTTGTGKTGKIIDRKGYIGPVLFDISYGSITATNATFTATVKEGDVTGTLTSVADADLIGTEAAAGLGATGTRTSGTSKNVAKKIGYKGGKRYCQINIKSTVTAGTPIAANAVQRAASQPAS